MLGSCFLRRTTFSSFLQISPTIVYLFDIISYGINGLAIKLYRAKTFNNNFNKEIGSPLQWYLKSIGLNITNEIYEKNKFSFDIAFFGVYDFYNLNNDTYINLQKKLINCPNTENYQKLKEYSNKYYDNTNLNNFINNYDYYHFCYCIEHLQKIKNIKNFDVPDKIYIKSISLLGIIKKLNNSILNKILNDLFVAKDEIDKKNFEQAYQILNNIINRNIKYFKKVC